MLWRVRDRPGQASLTGFAAQKAARSAADTFSPAAVWAGRTETKETLPDSRKPVINLDFAGISRTIAKREARESQRTPPSAKVRAGPPASLGHLASMARHFSNRQSSCDPVAQIDTLPGGAELGRVPATDGENGVPSAEQYLVGGLLEAGSKAVPAFGSNTCVDPGVHATAQGTAKSLPHIEAACESIPADNCPSASVTDGPHLPISMEYEPEPEGGQQPQAEPARQKNADEGHHASHHEEGDKMADTSLRAAQQIAAEARRRCDMLKGPPRSSREDPAFQANYFAASRLHFIGSWKARIEALAASMADIAPKASPPARGCSRAIIHMDMDCFFASVAGKQGCHGCHVMTRSLLDSG